MEIKDSTWDVVCLTLFLVAVVGLTAALFPIYMFGGVLPFNSWSPGRLFFMYDYDYGWGMFDINNTINYAVSSWRWDILGKAMMYGFGVYYLSGLVVILLMDKADEAEYSWHRYSEIKRRTGFLSSISCLSGIAFCLSFFALVLGFLLPPKAAIYLLCIPLSIFG